MRDFLKMQATGNDFLVFDTRKEPLILSREQMSHLSHRQFGVGCDQLILIEASEHAHAFMRIYNADGSESGACGNATRAIANHLMQEEANTDSLTIETISGILPVTRAEDGNLTVDMGVAKTDWKDIPLEKEMDCMAIPIPIDEFSECIAINVGNPHAVFFVDTLDPNEIIPIAPIISGDPLFIEGVNVNFALINDRNEITLHVYERGVGFTLSCGSGACATFAAAHLKGLVDKNICIHQQGGELWMSMSSDHHIFMTGSASTVYSGKITL